MRFLAIILGLLAVAHGACSGKSAADCGADATCVWSPGSCNVLSASDCTTSSCAGGCIATPPVQAACTAPTTCDGGNDEDACDDLGPTCSWSGSSCVNLTTPLNCVYSQETGSCTDGCELGSEPVCVPSQSHSDGGDCVGESTASMIECEIFCEISQNKCVPPAGVNESQKAAVQQICNQFSTTRKATECLLQGQGICIPSGTSCVVNTLMFQQFQEEEDITLEEAAAWCSVLSLTEMSECTSDRNCKNVGGTCQKKTQDEICQTYNVVPVYSECRVKGNGCCVESGTACVKDEDEYCADKTCSGYSVTNTTSDCVYRGGSQCTIVDGACRQDLFVCKLNAFKDDCDAASLAHDCHFNSKTTCTNINCPTRSSGECPSVGCSVASVGICSFSGSCYLMDSENCSAQSTTDGCEEIAASDGTCAVDTSIVASTCTSLKTVTSCQGGNGCKWSSDTGGKCDEAVNPNPIPGEPNPTNAASTVYASLCMLLTLVLMFL